MKKIFLLGLIGLMGFMGNIANAQAVSVELAQSVASHFWNSYRPNDVKPATTVTPLPFSELGHLHILNINGEGFVIVAGDERVKPILAYSFDSPCSEELNPETGYWLRGYEAQIAEVTESNAQQTESVKNAWMSLVMMPFYDEPVGSLQDIPAMMTTRWNQSAPYNNLCPYDSTRHGRTVVGCVATAMAQIMRYWSYPAYGQGYHTYNYRYFNDISADFENTSYLWHIMPPVCNEFSPEASITATATLSYHCGVAVEMMYGTSAEGGSGAYSSCGWWTSHCATSAFIDYFKYDSNLYHADRENYTDNDWKNLINNDLALSHPIYYSGHDSTGGHAFVFDGSDLEGRYHVNWGWGGHYDGFYTIDNLAPGGGGDGGNATYTFNYGQGAIFGIQPGMTEVFDTVDYFDSVCENTPYAYFRQYKLLVHNIEGRDTILHNFDTVFNYHLKVIEKKRLYLHPNNGDVPVLKTYCPATGYTFPNCPFEKTNCMFIGWCHDKDGNDVIYQPGETGHFNNSPTYYALWIDTSAIVGVDELEENEPAVWPTITSEHVNISFDDADAMTINIIDNWGRVVIQKESVGGKAKISLKRLPAGTYTMQILTKGTLYKSRIIKL